MKKQRQTSKEKQDFPIVVIGASAGGYKAIMELVRNLPLQTQAAVFVVLHLGGTSNAAFFLHHLQQQTSFRCKLPENGERIKHGTLYFGLSGVHLLVADNKIIFGNGPDENGFKPSIDALLRSAAVEFQQRTIGIILSGMLHDGVAGMMAIKRCGGICLIQDPAEAEYPDLPLAALEKVKVDSTISVADMGHTIARLAKRPKKKIIPPKEIVQEAKIAREVLTGIDETKKLGTESLFTCPECGGVLWHVNDNIDRYRCFTGHAFTENALLQQQGSSIQATLWVALRQFEERKKMLSKFSGKNIQVKRNELEKHIARLKNLLADLQMLNVSDQNVPIEGKPEPK